MFLRSDLGMTGRLIRMLLKGWAPARTRASEVRVHDGETVPPPPVVTPRACRIPEAVFLCGCFDPSGEGTLARDVTGEMDFAAHRIRNGVLRIGS